MPDTQNPQPPQAASPRTQDPLATAATYPPVTAQKTLLAGRGIVRASGPDARRLLHDVVTANVAELRVSEARWSALLTPQGKILFDFLLVCEAADSFLFDVERSRAADLAKRLLFYRLRAKMDLVDMSGELGAAAAWDGSPVGAPGLVYADPRLPAMGHRIVAPAAKLRDWVAASAVAAYEARRIELGLPEGGLDFPLGETFPHEACMDQLGGVDFAKGCYVGQEVVSRMQHRGTARTRVVPVRIEGLGESGEEVMAGAKPAGRLGSVAGNRGLALLRLDRAADALGQGEVLTAGEARLTLVKPAWARFAFPGEPGFGAKTEEAVL